MPRFYRVTTIACAAIMTLIGALPASANTGPVDFSLLDTNADAVIDFAEFSAFAKSQGQTRTQAAQIFIGLTNGDALITEKEYRLGATRLDGSTGTHRYALPALENAVEDVDSVTLQGRVIEVTPNEEVAGELIRAFEDERRNDGWNDDII